MPITAKLRHLHITPRKVRLVADLIRGKKAEEAKTILNFTSNKSSLPMLKLLNSAIANAKNDFQADASNLFVSKIFVDEGPKQKRWMPRARGQAYMILKRTSHVTLVLEEVGGKKVKAVGKKKAAEKQGVKKEEKIFDFKKDKPKFKSERKTQKIKTQKGATKIFRRKSI